ncbi:WXG100-like domain-containing protein [Actinoallomurus soli]|uniref:WXG100-like domain-containing protein n=1 Tax=Actinoallomurus soli TaxID=2952535 RepID=UPI002092C0F6|nr:hypothetical protein [Actinoallomurus soli]MCO5968798.1 hypothetical protein [Actinoallomurus soli]
MALKLGGLMGFAAAGDLLFRLATVTMPDGDPGACHQAADHWRGVAQRVKSSETAVRSIRTLMRDANIGPAAEGFEEFCTEKLVPYLERLSGGIAEIGDHCDTYGNELNQHVKALRLIEASMVANVAFCVWYGWATGGAGFLATEATIARLVFQARLEDALWRAFIRAFVEALSHQLIERMLWYAAIDSVMWAAMQQELQYVFLVGGAKVLGIDDKTMTDVAGFDPADLKTNLTQAGQAFVANAVFDLTMEGAGRQPYGKYFDRGNPAWRGSAAWKPALAGFAGRMSGSLAYSVAMDAQTGDWSNFTDSDKLWAMMFEKSLIHGTRIGVHPAQVKAG